MKILSSTIKRSQVFSNILLFLLLHVTLPAFSQGNNPQTNNPYQNIIPSSPTVAALEKFGNYPISYNTGTVGISTDLYSFPLGKGLNLGVRLDYHSSGIKVEEVSGRTGLGWSLSAGGCISREVRGLKDDDAYYGFFNLAKTHKSYQNIQALSDRTLDSIANGWLDSEPDIFSINVDGLRYKFFYGNDGEFHTIPYSNIKIKMGGIGAWEIVDESGIRYIFKETELVEEQDMPYRNYISAWWLHSIISAEGIPLAGFEYRRSSPVYHPVDRHTFAFETWSTPEFGIPGQPSKEPYLGYKTLKSRPPLYDAADLYKISIPGKGSLIFEQGTTRPDQQWKLISEIKYYDNEDVLVNKYTFSYKYQSQPFLMQINKTDSDGTTIKYRAFTYNDYFAYRNSQDLWGYYNGASNNNLFPYDNQFVSCAGYISADRYPTNKAVSGTIKEIIYPTGGRTLFEFENNKVYSTDNIYTVVKKGIGHKHTGYGEETSDSFTTIDTKNINMEIDMSIHPAGVYTVDIKLVRTIDNSAILHYTNASVPGNGFIYKGPNADATERFVNTFTNFHLPAGTYKWVTKITGNGITTMKPAPIIIWNDYYQKVASTSTSEKLVGGLRIACISNYDSNGKLTGKTKYTYLNRNGKCSGIGAPMPEFVSSYVVTEYSRRLLPYPIYLGIKKIGETSLLRYSGSAVQYTYVTEEKTGEGKEPLKTDYEYRQRRFGRFIHPHIKFSDQSVPFSLNDYEEGLLTAKTDYCFRNNAYTPIRKEYNTYMIDEKDVPAFTALSLNKYYLSPESAPADCSVFEKYMMGTYDFTSAKVYLSSKKTEEITEGGTITNIHDYFYENATYQQLTRSRRAGSNGLVSEAMYKYCYDENTPVTGEMKNKNILTPLYTVDKVDNRQTRLVNVIYGMFPGNILEPKIIREQTTVSAPYSETTYHNYDKYGNPLSISRNDADKVAYLWSYNGQYPIAEIKNATFTEAEAAVKTVFTVTSTDALSTLAIPNETKLKDGSLQKALPNALITTYTYKPLVGMLTSTDPAGITTYYEYDDFGRLKRTYIKEGTTEKTIQTYDYHYQNQ